MNKRKLCAHIIAKMEWWRNAKWAEHIDERTKNEVITVLENVVDSVANFRQTYADDLIDIASTIIPASEEGEA